jgi:hypothetical protein
MTPDEKRQAMGLDTMGGMMEQVYIPSNMVPIGMDMDLNLEAELTYTDKIFENGH